jgi:hypothetical protein
MTLMERLSNILIKKCLEELLLQAGKLKKKPTMGNCCGRKKYAIVNHCWYGDVQHKYGPCTSGSAIPCTICSYKFCKKHQIHKHQSITERTFGHSQSARALCVYGACTNPRMSGYNTCRTHWLGCVRPSKGYSGHP